MGERFLFCCSERFRGCVRRCRCIGKCVARLGIEVSEGAVRRSVSLQKFHVENDALLHLRIETSVSTTRPALAPRRSTDA